MGCDNCDTSPSGQAIALTNIRAAAKKYAIENEKTMAVYKEGYEYRYCEYSVAVANGYAILEMRRHDRPAAVQLKAAAAATDNLYRLDLVFQALSDSHRRFMLTVLSRGPRPVSDLAGLAVASWSAGLKHLRLLEASGLIHTEKIGRVRTCYLNADTLKMAEAWLGKRRTTADRSNRPLR